ncbi:hypothetical protein [Streptomyces sp. NPDC091027]|uniref:hypothetical protein n=1 Tax=Streptomyces sp. NPDC091027 TaxID=3365971 RepID=UPI0038168B0E
MHALRILPGPEPRTGVLPALRAAVLAALCVLLPLGGHALLREHTPGTAALVALAVVALPVCRALARRRLTDTQALAAFLAAQTVYHVCYVLPGACTAFTGAAPQGHSPVLLGGHAVTLLLAARLVGAPQSLLWHGRPLAEHARRLLGALLPLLTAATAGGHGPEAVPATGASPLPPSAPVPPRPGRAPPVPAPLTRYPSRPPAVTGLRLAS